MIVATVRFARPSGESEMVWLAVAPRDKLEPGGFYFDRMRRSTHEVPWTRETPEEREEREVLWRLAEGLA